MGKLQSWSKVMVHLAFFDNFTVPSPPPPPPRTMLVQCAQSVPLEATLYGGGGGGGRAKFGKKSRFYYRTGGDNENKANFQGVPYTFDQDCRLHALLRETEKNPDSSGTRGLVRRV